MAERVLPVGEDVREHLTSITTLFRVRVVNIYLNIIILIALKPLINII